MPDQAQPSAQKLSRRSALRKGAALGTAALAPQVATAQARPANAGRKFRAFVRYQTGVSIQELRLLPIQPREVLLRTEASGVCYTIVSQVLSTNNAARATIPNHS